MKLITYQLKNSIQDVIGVLSEDEQWVIPIQKVGLCYKSMNELIEKISQQEMKQLNEATKHGETFSASVDEIRLRAPIPEPKQDIICLGINYLEHAKESARYKKEAFDLNRDYPVYFSKRVNECTAHKENIKAYKPFVDSLDYEVELAVIIGKDAKAIPAERCRKYIFGYTILNDMSARNIQTRHKQWYFGKSMDGFAPMGPVIVTKNDIPYPPNLNIQSYVNDELRQDARTDQFIFDIDYVIHELSQCMTLKAGTIISMGTPKGVGMGFHPPKFLKPGDEVTCIIENIGTLTNKIIESEGE